MIKPRSIVAFGLVSAAVLGLAGASYSIAQSNTVPAAEGAVSMDAVRPQIGAVGTVEPRGGTLSIAPAVAGLIVSVLVVPGDTVQAGQPLVKLDDRLAQARIGALVQAIESAEAALEDVRGTLPTLQAQVEVAEAAVLSSEVQRAEAAVELATSEQLASGQTVSRRDVERKATALRAADAAVAEAQARLTQAEAERDRTDSERSGTRLLPLKAAIDDARAALSTAQAELDLLTVRSPIAAQVLEVNAKPGEYAGLAGDLPGLVTLAARGNLQVRAEVEEADVPKMIDGSAAVGFVRGGGSTAIPLSFVRREPLLKPKTTLNGSDAERIDTRIVEVLFELGRSEIDVVPGQLLDILIETEAP